MTHAHVIDGWIAELGLAARKGAAQRAAADPERASHKMAADTTTTEPAATGRLAGSLLVLPWRPRGRASAPALDAGRPCLAC